MRFASNVKATHLVKVQALLVVSTLWGCGTDRNSPNHGIGELAVPDRAEFPLVADVMQHRCGTLDCHGQMGRNLRLFGRLGLRLDTSHDPFEPPTTEAEYDASYLSVIGLEPETTSKVIKRELTPVQLAFVRKPRAIELHKGHQLMTQGDPLDRCLVSWLLGAFDADACTTVIETPRPEPDGGPK